MTQKTGATHHSWLAIKSFAKAVLPRSCHAYVRRLTARIAWFGVARYCPICRSHLRQFVPLVLDTGELAVCPVCLSHGRQRLLWLWLLRKSDVFANRAKRLLHIAPLGGEQLIAQHLSKSPYIEYVGADKNSPEVAVKMDITAIQYPADFFDIVICSHVLEHVLADRTAMAELLRVLKPDGWAVIQVPVTTECTRDFYTEVVSAEKRSLSGEHHVRECGLDYSKRLEDAGFAVQAIPCRDAVVETEVSRCELIAAEDKVVWLCRKRAQGK